MHNKWWKSILHAMLAILPLLATGPGYAQGPYDDLREQIDPDLLRAHVHALAVEIGTRPAGSEAEMQAGDYIAGQLSGWGYAVEIQSFEIARGDRAIASRNVIATRWPESGNADQVVIVGAHMDSVTAGTGADDNASGVSAMLAAAQVLADRDLAHPVVFVAFGAEEIGLEGSRYFVDQLSPDDLAAIQVMINIDTVGIGDYLYIYAGADVYDNGCRQPFERGDTGPRDQALALGAALGHDVRTSPPTNWDGFTALWSDHAAFVTHGIPVVYFERWNWDAGSNPCWGQETAARDYLHTAQDIFENVDAAKIEPVAEILAALVITLTAIPDTVPGQ
jgi:alkaline phosphatase isozyme conversion protein